MRAAEHHPGIYLQRRSSSIEGVGDSGIVGLRGVLDIMKTTATVVTEYQDGWAGPGPASSGRVGIQLDGVTFWSRIMNTQNGTTDFLDAVATAETMVNRINAEEVRRIEKDG